MFLSCSYFDLIIQTYWSFADKRQYYNTVLPFITNQTHCHQDTACSVLESSTSELAVQQEWENEWNQLGLPSRLSEKVCHLFFCLLYSNT